MSEISDLFGKTVEVYKISETLNDRGDVTKATSSTVTTVAEIQVMRGDESEVRAGILQPGDAIGFFDPTLDLEIGDEVSYDGATYRIVGLIKEKLDNTEKFWEAHLKKIVE